MFTTFSAVPLSPSPTDVLHEVQDILDRRDMTFAALLVRTLQDTTTTMGTTIVSDLANVLEAFRPHLDEDEKARVLFGQFFASIASPELSQFGRGDDEISWNLPATNLSTEQLMEFNLEEMEKRIASDAPALSSFLGGICSRSKPGGRGTSADMDVDELVEDSEDSDDELGGELKIAWVPTELRER